MSIYIYKNNQQAGPFEDSHVIQMLGAGQISGGDLACRTGGTQWQPLASLISMNLGAVPAIGNANDARAMNVSGAQVLKWAQQNLAQPVEVKPKFDSIGAKLALALFIFFLPIAVLLFGVFRLVVGGGGLPIIYLSGFLFLIFGMIGVFALLIGKLTRRKMVKFLDARCAETRNGTRFEWENLQSLHFRKFRNPPFNPLVAIVNSIIFAGSDRMTIEMIFTGGKAVVAPLIRNSKEVHDLVRSIPVAKTGDV